MQPVVPILVSSGRSGLTLLGMIFDSHPDLTIAHEPRFLATMAPRRDRYEQGGRLDLGLFLDDLYSVGNFKRLGLPREELRRRLEEAEPATFADGVRVVFDAYARHRGKRLYGDKTPLYVTFIRPIAELLPETKFIHLVRDGRDVVLAYLERDKGPASVAEGAYHWRLRVTRGHRDGRLLGPDRYREFHYEDLVEDTEATVREMCRFLGIAFHPQMLDYQETSRRFLAEAKNPGDHQHLVLAPTKGLIDWRTEMAPRDVALFEAIAGDALEELGYERGAGHRVSKLTVWWEWLRWQTRRVIWRLRWILFRKPPRQREP